VWSDDEMNDGANETASDLVRDVVGFCRWCLQGSHFSGISGNLETSGIRLRSGKRPKVRDRSANVCTYGNLIVAA